MKNSTFVYKDESFLLETNSNLDFYSLAYKHFHDSLVPFFNITNEEKNEFESVGTGLYIHFNGYYYLITARHVSEYQYFDFNQESGRNGSPQIPKDENHIGNIPCLISEEGFFLCTKTNSFNIDIAIYPLSEPLTMFIPLDITNEFPEIESTSFLCMGYPSSRFIQKKDDTCKSQVVNYIGPIGKINPLEQKKDEKYIGAVKFIKDKCFDINKNNAVFPKPNGMSGGICIGFDKDKQTFILSGIITSYEPDRTKNQILQFTNIETVRTILKNCESKYQTLRMNDSN